jgi:hypothetical protein
MKDLDKAAQAALRDINRRLASQIRNDFAFPDPAALPEGVPALVNEDPDIPTSPAVASGSSQARRPLRERFYGTTDDSSDEEVREVDDGGMYAFDSPDTVGDELERRVGERRKRKRTEMEEEMAWNGGLCFFQRRRNVWTGAMAKAEAEDDGERAKQPKLATSSDSSPVHTPTSATSAPGADDAAQADGPMDGVEPTTVQAPASTPSRSTAPISQWIPAWHTPSFQPPADPAALTNVQIPVAPPLIPPSNPVRITLASRSPSELYAKIVRDSRTPAIPVNLADMTRIIVQGWKDEGNWPPRGTAPEASMAARRGAGVLARREREEGLLKHHPHLQRGVEGVKRVFRLSGSGHGSEDFGKKPVRPSVVKGDVGSAFRSHE